MKKQRQNNITWTLAERASIIRPGLFALYDILPRNGAGLFLQPQSPHRALTPTADNGNHRT